MVTHVMLFCVRTDLFDFKCYLNKANKILHSLFIQISPFRISWFDITVFDIRLHRMYLQMSSSATRTYVRTYIRKVSTICILYPKN